MTVQRDTLSEALRELAATSPQASPELGARLQEAFARHHAQRRLRRRAAVAAGLAACLVTALAWLTTAKQAREVRKPPAQVAKTLAPEQQLGAPRLAQRSAVSVTSPAAKSRGRGKQLSKARNHSVEAPVVIAAGDFIALPSFDSAVPLGDSRMLRVDLPGSALQLMGYPIDGQLLDRRVEADVLVSQDGSPYAVRLVNARNLH